MWSRRQGQEGRYEAANLHTPSTNRIVCPQVLDLRLEMNQYTFS